jgi:hypothetical protein
LAEPPRTPRTGCHQVEQLELAKRLEPVAQVEQHEADETLGLAAVVLRESALLHRFDALRFGSISLACDAANADDGAGE